MLAALVFSLRDWLAFHHTLAALRGLDPHLRADLGVTDADLPAIARRAVAMKGPISLYRLRDEDAAPKAPNPAPDPTGPVCRPAALSV